MKKLLITIILLSFLFFTENTPAQLISPSVLTTARKSTVALFMEFETSGIGYCTGVVIKNEDNYSEVLTAKHCTDGKQTIIIGTIRASHYVIDTNNDLAVVYFKKKEK